MTRCATCTQPHATCGSTTPAQTHLCRTREKCRLLRDQKQKQFSEQLTERREKIFEKGAAHALHRRPQESIYAKQKFFDRGLAIFSSCRSIRWTSCKRRRSTPEVSAVVLSLRCFALSNFSFLSSFVFAAFRNQEKGASAVGLFLCRTNCLFIPTVRALRAFFRAFLRSTTTSESYRC